MDGAGALVWASSDYAPGSAPTTQLLSSGSPALSCVYSGPQPAASELVSERSAFFQGALRLLGNGRPEPRADGTQALVWTPTGFPALPAASYKLCVSSRGTLQVQRAMTLDTVLWQAPAGAGSPAAAGPYTLKMGDAALVVLDGTCRQVYSTATGAAGTGASRSGGTAGGSPVRQSPATARAAPAGLLQAKALCGGILLCGTDTACPKAGTCRAGLSCVRITEYVWQCA
jgi:hypothetical protein